MPGFHLPITPSPILPIIFTVSLSPYHPLTPSWLLIGMANFFTDDPLALCFVISDILPGGVVLA
jgi:hypothetical protein